MSHLLVLMLMCLYNKIYIILYKVLCSVDVITVHKAIRSKIISKHLPRPTPFLCVYSCTYSLPYVYRPFMCPSSFCNIIKFSWLAFSRCSVLMPRMQVENMTVINTHRNGCQNMATAIEHLCLALYSYIFKNYILNSHINHLFQSNH